MPDPKMPTAEELNKQETKEENPIEESNEEERRPNLDVLSEKKEINEIVPGEWMKIDEMEVSYPSDDEQHTIERSNDPEQVGMYNTNNGIIVYITPRGERFAGTRTTENLKALEDAGYEENSGIGVQMSNGEEPINSHQRDLWRGIKAKGIEQVKKENEEERLEDFQKAAENK